MMKRQLILEDGTVFVGEGFGASVERIGEVVFNTGMTGYQELLTDASYCGQIVTMTYPLIGNVGINADDFESSVSHVFGFIVKEYADVPSNWRSEKTLDDFLKQNNIPGLSGIDTRKLVKHIRSRGIMKGVICDVDVEVEQKVAELEKTEMFKNHLERVSTKTSYKIDGNGRKVAVIDCGLKQNILRELSNRNCECIVMPYNTTPEELMQINPDGVVFTNGPGDPKDACETIELMKYVVGKIPTFGICLGHQLFALAMGGDTEKLTFGHRGNNHPVKDVKNGKVQITSQNHGYAVTKESLSETDLDITHESLNDDTVEGLEHKFYKAFSVQFHPEASPGPNDSSVLFDKFIEMMGTSYAD